MKALCLLACSVGLAAADLPKVFYSKSFPGSVPAFVSITLDNSGRAEYREAPDDDNPLVFQLSKEDAAEVFGLATKLDRFSRPLESNLKVAKTGVKTFRYDDGKEKHEVQFNYSLDPAAQTLLDWFERMAETESRFIGLQNAAKFDKLGVDRALLLLEASRDRNRIVAKEQFLPLLDRIARNESYLHMARVRAANLADSFRNNGTASK